jgi:nicotinamide mononucleotide adenylyltransferase
MTDTKTFYTPDAVIHVVPLNDLREHEARTDCWCKPAEDDEYPDIWVHHSMDQREQYEEGRELT